jgi:N-acetylneuraminic acid mutarotase
MRSLDLLAAAACGSAAPTGWQPRAKIASGGRLEGAVVAAGNKVYLLGGWDQGVAITNAVSVYDPATDSWSEAKAMPRELHHLNAASVDGKIWVVGSLYGLNFQADGVTMVYDPATDMWTTKAPMPSGTERGASAIGVIGSSIYVAGGSSADAVDTVSVYDTTTGTWTPLAPMPQPRYHAVGAVVNGLFYAMGGLTAGIPAGTATPVTDLYVYDPTKDMWSQLPSMTAARGGCASGIVAGLIICAGGEGSIYADVPVPADTEAFDPIAGTWSELQPMRTPRAGTSGAVVDDVLYVPGGAKHIAYDPVDVNESFSIRR